MKQGEKKTMKMRELVSEIVIDPRKLTDYALDSESLRGKNKALMFQRHLGYTKENYQILLDQINDLILDAEATPQSEDQFGTRYQVDLEIQGIEPQQVETVRTGWLIAPNSQQAKLTTLYVAKR
jgi:hypothetical protein